MHGGNGVLIYMLGDQDWPSDKVTLEKELKDSKGASFMEIREKQFQIEKTTNTKALSLVNLRNRKEASITRESLTAINFAFMEKKKSISEKEVHIFET